MRTPPDRLQLPRHFPRFFFPADFFAFASFASSFATSDDFDRPRPERLKHNLVSRLQNMGYKFTLEPAA